MKAKIFILGIVSLVLVITLTACGGNGGSDASVLTQNTTDAEKTPPDDYAGLSNPLKNEAATLDEGRSLYQANCSSCHGPGGEGDGPAAGGLAPKPQNLAQNQSQLSDDYLFWRISEGGLMDPFNSLMPAWKGLLNDEQIWQIITYVRTMGS